MKVFTININGRLVDIKQDAVGKFIIPDNFRKKGRFPANIILECTCDEIIDGKHTDPNCPCYTLDEQSGNKCGQLAATNGNEPSASKRYQVYNDYSKTSSKPSEPHDSLGGASRFFYTVKASKKERGWGCEDLHWQDGKLIDKEVYTKLQEENVENEDNVEWEKHSLQTGNIHCTVKPLSLMKYLCTLTKTPTGGIVLDPFAGSGSTLCAAKIIGRPYIGIEMAEEYIPIIEARLKAVYKGFDLKDVKVAKKKVVEDELQKYSQGHLF